MDMIMMDFVQIMVTNNSCSALNNLEDGLLPQSKKKTSKQAKHFLNFKEFNKGPSSYKGQSKPLGHLNEVKHLEKMCSVREGHLYIHEFPS